MNSNGIVADGRENALKESANWKGFYKVAIEIRKKYRKEISQAGFFRRIYLNWRMDAELEDAKSEWSEKFAPKGALYFNAQGGDVSKSPSPKMTNPE